jgi:hypothetical protein
MDSYLKSETCRVARRLLTDCVYRLALSCQGVMQDIVAGAGDRQNGIILVDA